MAVVRRFTGKNFCRAWAGAEVRLPVEFYSLFGTVALLARCKRLQQVMAAFREIVMRYVVAVLMLLLGISSSLAQSHMGTPQEQQACSRDASRFCRQLLGNDSAVQQCLQQNRSRLSRSCQKVFASHGM